MKKAIALLICILITVSAASGCGRSGSLLTGNREEGNDVQREVKEGKISSSGSGMEFSCVPREYGVSFTDDDGSARVLLNAEAADRFIGDLSDISLDYEYVDLYGLDECYDRIFTSVNVLKHEKSALDEDGKLTAERLLSVVEENNSRFCEENSLKKYHYREVDRDFLFSICELIVDSVEEIKERYPNIDYDHLYCNLADLVIFYRVGSLNFAAVTSDMKMELGNAMLNFANTLAGGNGVRDVIIHETMHIIQLACKCEKTEHCTRRAGVTYRWDDVELQGNDWAWFFEGSAEQVMTMLTGDEPMTYKNMINYIQSVNLATFLRSDLPANYAQTVCFYTDPYMLTDLFGARSEQEIREMACLMEAVQIIQYMPDDFMTKYKEIYGIDLSDEDNQNAVRYSLKPAICLTFSKTFYKNLAKALTENDNVTENDVLYLIRVFEAAMDYHTAYTNPDKTELNQPFIDRYKEIRSSFFSALRESGSMIEENALFDYGIFSTKSGTAKDESQEINASLAWLDKEKKEFLAERTEFLSAELESVIK